MRGFRRRDDERRVEAVVGHAAEAITPPTPDELRRSARRAATPRDAQRRPAADGRRSWRPPLPGVVLAAAATLLLATGLGFGIGSRLTPAGNARSGLVGMGFGFLPAPGWTVIQAGLPGTAESTRAIAANVWLQKADPRHGWPRPVLGAWPSWGILVVATVRVRGDARADAVFPVRSLPLRLAEAVPVASRGQPAQEYRLRAAVGGYDIDANISFGGVPTLAMLDRADRQLARLVVAPQQVTMAVRPTVVVPQQPVTAYGSVASGKAGENVTVQFKQCGLYPLRFRNIAEATTSDGGGWSTPVSPGANGTFRTMVGGDVSNEVKVLARADVRLSPTRSGLYQAYVVEQASFWHKRVLIQRYDRRRGKWVQVKTVLLTEADAASGSAFVWSGSTKFALKVPKGTTVRAVLPLSQARPCQIAGYSRLLRR